MDVIHPGSKPLDADQLSLLETFRGKVDSRITARRIPRVCAEPVMKKENPKSRQV